MAKFIAVNILEYKIYRLIDKRNRAIELGRTDEVWKLTMKINNARDRMITWCYWSL